MGERNTAWLLQEWGQWVRYGGGVDLRARSAMQSVMTCAVEHDVIVADITEDDALDVDRAMAKLKMHRPEFYRVLWLACVRDFSLRETSSSMGISREAAGKLYEAAYTWIDFALNVDIFLSENEKDELFLQAA